MGDKFVIGLAVLVGIVAGGNSAPSYFVDGLLQLLIVFVSGFVIWHNAEERLDRRVAFLVLATIAVVLLQLVPLPTEWLNSQQGIVAAAGIDIESSMRPISLNIGRTLEVLAWTLSLSLLLVAISKIGFNEAYGLVPIFLIGVVCHMMAGIVQYSSASTQVAENMLGFTFRAGMFANANHFSALMFISIPLAFAYFYDRRRLLLFLIYLIAVLLVLLAVGSRAGVVIGFAITLLSMLILFRRGVFGTLSLLLGSAVMGIYGIGLWARISQEGLQQGARETFALTTVEGIWDNLLVGVGYGNFVDAYRSYESTEDILSYYANHAHNDFLELLFEGGLPVGVLMILFVVVFFKRVAETIRLPVHYACSLSLLFLLLHSVVDYPLRTMAISISFCLMLAILFHRGLPAENPDRDNDNGPEILQAEEPV